MQRKDPESLEKALVLLQNTVFSFSMKMCGQHQDAEDAMQEVLLSSIPHLPKFNSPKALLVWLYKVAKTRCLMSRRKSKFAPKEALSLEELMPDRQELRRLPGKSEPTPETSLMSREDAKRVRGAIQQLPPGYRLILVLHDMEELSDDDIAEITGLRPGAIRVRLHRARLFVRKELAKQDRQGAQGEAKKQAAVAQTHPRQGNCKQMFNELSNYLDQELDDSLCAEMEKHIEGCAPCKAFLASLEETIRTCKTVPNEPPDARMAANLRREVLSKYQGLMAQLNSKSKKRTTADRAQAH